MCDIPPAASKRHRTEAPGPDDLFSCADEKPTQPKLHSFLCLAPLAAASIVIGMECFNGLNTVKMQMLYSVTLVVTTLLLAMTLTAPKECKTSFTEKKDKGSQCQRAKVSTLDHKTRNTSIMTYRMIFCHLPGLVRQLIIAQVVEARVYAVMADETWDTSKADQM